MRPSRGVGADPSAGVQVSELVSECCGEASIAVVQLLPEHQAERICAAACVMPIATPSAAAVKEADLGAARGYRACVIGNKQCVHLLVDGTEGGVKAHTLLLRAPSQSLCTEYMALVRRGFAIVSSATVRSPLPPDLQPGHSMTAGPDRAQPMLVPAPTDTSHTSAEEDQDFIVVLPGAGAVEAGMVGTLEALSGDEPWPRGMLDSARHRRPPGAASLRVLRAALWAVPATLARAATPPKLVKAQLNDLQRQQRQGAACGECTARSGLQLGLLVRPASCSPHCTCLGALLGQGSARTETSQDAAICARVGNVVQNGVVESFGGKFTLLLSVLDAAVQMLRLDGMVAVKSIAPTGSRHVGKGRSASSVEAFDASDTDDDDDDDGEEESSGYSSSDTSD
ncbi:hypothetical protein CYMTET_8172 [Cymbomonas tetramitiformis]|uniref:Uncharacterized protein n=1 Tax=Cymbomonas tetramitiformis TaxID=36881 RepID=A0AAE0GTT5_9CHLO|nr:hypothetical protein CYMTET_8172 [Cymbomonas tetramitiformis]